MCPSRETTSDERAFVATTRCGYVALIGAPNTGKSTLLNTCVGTKVSIVTHKVQTTRCLVRGIVIRDGTQIIFVDTPGLFTPKRQLEKAMVSAAWAGAFDADMVALMIGARDGFGKREAALANRVRPHTRHLILIINKIDTIKRTHLLALAKEANDQCLFENTFMISALNGDGVGGFLDHIGQTLPAGPWLYEPDRIADMPVRLLAAEMTREQVFLRLHAELPYTLTVETTGWNERPDGSLAIEQTLYVTHARHRQIALGRKGATIKAISIAARGTLEDVLSRKVHLLLFVKVRENWLNDPGRYAAIGLEIPSG